MANVKVPDGARRLSLGGALFDKDEKYIGDGSNTYKINEMCYVSAGTLVPVATSATALSTGSAPFDAVQTYAFTLKAYTAATSDLVKAQEVCGDTVFEAYVVNTAAADVTMDQTDIGKTYQLYRDANGRIAVNNVATNGIARIIDVEANYDPHADPSRHKDEDGTKHTRVKFKLIDSILAI
jgi:hypothetical protein